MKKQHLQLKPEHLSYLTTLLSKGTLKARAARRATALLHLHQGATLETVAQLVGVVYQSVSAWRDKYLENGLDFWADKPRAGRPIVFDGRERAQLTALACSDAPEGSAKWSLRVLADKAVELELVERVSDSKVREILKKRNLSPHLKKTRVHWDNECRVFSTDGTNIVALPIAF